MALMSQTKLSPTVAPEDNQDLDYCQKDESTTASTGSEGDAGYNPEAYYTNLENVLENVETDQGCYNNDVWQDYSDAVAAARAAMYEIADPVEYEYIDGVRVPSKYKGYYQTKDVIDALREAIEKAAEDLTPENSHHLYRFVDQAYNSSQYASIGNFTCSKNALHEPDTADMDTYNALATAYASLDKSKYTSDGINSIKAGKKGFDEILLTDLSYTDDEDEIHDMTPEEVAHNDEMRAICNKRNDAMNAIIEMKEQMKAQAIAEAQAAGKTQEEIDYIVEHLFDDMPGPAQSLVDSGITELLEAIYDANEDATTETHTTRNIKIMSGYVNEYGDIQKDLVSDLDIKYGEQFSVLGDDVLDESLTVDYWSVEIDGRETKFADDGTETFESFATSDMIITAWYTEESAPSRVDVSIFNAIGQPIHKFSLRKDKTITIVNNNKILVDNTYFEIVNTSSYKIDSWTANGKAFTGARLVSELEKDGEIVLKPVTHRVLGKYDVYLDGRPQLSQIDYDYHHSHMAKKENSVCLAVYQNGRFIPVTYGDEYDFYANVLFENFFSVYYNADDDVFYRRYRNNGQTVTENISFTSDYKFRIKNKLPFTVNAVEQDSEDATKWNFRATYTMNLAGNEADSSVKNAVVTEAGVLYTFNAMTADELNFDNIDNTDYGIAKYVSVTQKANNQYSVRINTANGTRYARSYIKYQYEFEGKTISAISYGDIVICEKP